MVQVRFGEFVKSICAYYERRVPGDKAMELWFDRVKGIPDEALPWIQVKLTDELDSFPRNLPQVVNELYRAWQGANPDKIAGRSYFDCPDCNEGIIRAYKIVKENVYRYVFQCAVCRQSRFSGWPTMRKKQIEEAGFVVESRDRPKRPQIAQERRPTPRTTEDIPRESETPHGAKTVYRLSKNIGRTMPGSKEEGRA